MAPVVNGDAPSSAFLHHLGSYPVVSDSISTIKSYPVGQKTLQLADHGYNAIAKPVIPYLAKPYEYVSPYVIKADSIGDSTLSKVDDTFPIVKKPTGELYNDGKDLVFFPVRKAFEAKDYLFSTWAQQVKECGGPNLVAYGKAAITTPLIVSSETLSWIAQGASRKKAELKEVTNEKLNN